jgi:hypothetical protein
LGRAWVKSLTQVVWCFDSPSKAMHTAAPHYE